MRWDGLFADLEGQAEALSIAERSAEIEDRTRYETGQLALIDRLRPSIGQPLRLRCLGAVSVSGVLRRAHPDWLLIEESAGREALLIAAALCSIAGLGRQASPVGSASIVQSRLGLRHALRLVARDRSSVRMHLRDASVLDGTLDRVGADHV
ncbi:MAG: hypothetical protein ABI418_06850, partial [Jatrophihabitantaceae bacterium]